MSLHELIPQAEMAQAILDQAEELFAQKGYAAVSIREICAATGITKPTLYYYFVDKESLYIATMLRRLTGYRELIAAQAPDEPVRQRLIRLGRGIFTSMQTPVDMMLHDMENITNPEHHIRLGAAFSRELYMPIVACMASGIERGELRAGDAQLYAKLYLGLVNAFISQPTHGPAAQGDAAVAWPSIPQESEARAALVVGLMIDGIGR